MKHAASLRIRLTAIILLPLMTIAILAGLWQMSNARRTAADVFDRGLLSAAIGVANDIAISEGDALSERTRDILAGTSGGPVFYHVYAPDGVIVAGYATPPVGIPGIRETAASPTYFDAIYLGRSVRGVRIQNRTEIDGFAGIFTTTVWQDRAVRVDFVRDLVMRSFITISGLILSLALIVWFGVRLGLRPLIDLEQAIEQRSSADLSPIRRAVPEEVAGIVSTLNTLFAQVSRSMTAQSEFIANAAHQLRNPIAGVLALAEALNTAPTPAESKTRAQDLLDAARETADLSQKLLMLERADAISPHSVREVCNLSTEMPHWIQGFRDRAGAGVKVVLDIGPGLGAVTCDPVMLREAVTNLVDNACRHGGADLSQIMVIAREDGPWAVLEVCDDGQGMPPENLPKAVQRFAQLSDTSGSGLGVSIVQAIAHGHDGTLDLLSDAAGFRAQLRIPLQAVKPHVS